eukprot:CAMPEP_0170150448 /NCGR_PEP_ID=MMETSP0033_2-20121228/46444_1 /TAXON_ID=195969 /ORGANISM="Dolichomastix tenuilepis, Strain CCMP3274" /LENGTH=108 /DNA_ID=CAMNT_0010387481 /DNA_START=212 /DNA_END=538 /DNA_ORIENTATION=-
MSISPALSSPFPASAPLSEGDASLCCAAAAFADSAWASSRARACAVSAFCRAERRTCKPIECATVLSGTVSPLSRGSPTLGSAPAANSSRAAASSPDWTAIISAVAPA